MAVCVRACTYAYIAGCPGGCQFDIFQYTWCLKPRRCGDVSVSMIVPVMTPRLFFSFGPNYFIAIS